MKAAVADCRYGTIENYLSCYDRNIELFLDCFDKNKEDAGTRKGIFKPSDFVYNLDENFFYLPGKRTSYAM